MEKAYINFKQKRDFGEVINATFAFIGQEFKPLGKAILFYVLPILIIASILSMFVNIEQQKFLRSLRTENLGYTANPFTILGNTYKYTALVFLVYLVAVSCLRCTIYGYIKVYIEKGKGQFTMEDVWTELKHFFLPVMGTSIVIGLLIFVGMIFCLVPGIWLGVSLSLIYILMIYEGKGMGDAFNRSFNLTKQAWWITLAIALVSYLIVYIISIVLSLPGLIVGVTSAFTSIKNSKNPADMNFSTSFYILNSITQLITYLLFSIPFIAISFQYFNLLEMKEKPSLQEKIEQIA